jgi:hypothetical protein
MLMHGALSCSSQLCSINKENKWNLKNLRGCGQRHIVAIQS